MRTLWCKRCVNLGTFLEFSVIGILHKGVFSLSLCAAFRRARTQVHHMSTSGTLQPQLVLRGDGAGGSVQQTGGHKGERKGPRYKMHRRIQIRISSKRPSGRGV